MLLNQKLVVRIDKFRHVLNFESYKLSIYVEIKTLFQKDKLFRYRSLTVYEFINSYTF